MSEIKTPDAPVNPVSTKTLKAKQAKAAKAPAAPKPTESPARAKYPIVRTIPAGSRIDPDAIVTEQGLSAVRQCGQDRISFQRRSPAIRDGSGRPSLLTVAPGVRAPE